MVSLTRVKEIRKKTIYFSGISLTFADLTDVLGASSSVSRPQMRDDYEYDLRGRLLAAAINKLQNGFPFFLITYNHGILLSSDKL